jgi:hypothetical protein
VITIITIFKVNGINYIPLNIDHLLRLVSWGEIIVCIELYQTLFLNLPALAESGD